MRRLFITDIHGQYDAMIALLREAEYKPGVDHLIVGGDMIDRGPDSGPVIKQLKSLHDRFPHHVHIIGGNHEDMVGLYLAGVTTMWLEHGGNEALKSFEDTFKVPTELEDHLEWLIKLPSMYTDDDYVFVHAGLRADFGLHEQTRTEVRWMPHLDSQIHFYNDYTVEDILHVTDNRKVLHGHTPRGYIFDDGARICCDLGASVRNDGKLALVDIDNDSYWQYFIDIKQITKRKIARKKVTS